MNDLLTQLTKAAVCVYVATDEDSAKQISNLLTEAKNKIVTLTQQVEELKKGNSATKEQSISRFLLDRWCEFYPDDIPNRNPLTDRDMQDYLILHLTEDEASKYSELTWLAYGHSEFSPKWEAANHPVLAECLAKTMGWKEQS